MLNNPPTPGSQRSGGGTPGICSLHLTNIFVVSVERSEYVVQNEKQLNSCLSIVDGIAHYESYSVTVAVTCRLSPRKMIVVLV